MSEAGTKRILVAVDKSDQARRMAEYVAEMLRPEAVEITLLNIYNNFPEVYWDFMPDHAIGVELPPFGPLAEKKSQDLLVKVIDDLLAAGFKRERIRALARELGQGVARDIASEALDGYHLLALGARGESTLADLVLGSIPAKLISSLTCTPLCLVNGRPASTRTLAALDGSEESLRALTVWAGLVRPDCEITLFHVVRESGLPEPEAGFSSTLREPSSIWVEDHLRSFNRVLETARARLAKLGFDESRVLVKIVRGAASRAGAIIEEAVHGHYGGIVLGRRGFSRVMEHDMGRVAYKVVQVAREKAIWLIP